MTKEIAINNDMNSEIMLEVVNGDISKMSKDDKLQYFAQVCKSMKLNPLTKPFDFIKLNGREVLYCTRAATDQLRQIHKVSIEITNRERIDDVYVVTAKAYTVDGRCDVSTGAVTIGALKGDALANALMKAETKAKRRVTLSIVGLGWLDESELETIPNVNNQQQVKAVAPQAKKEIIAEKQHLLQLCAEHDFDKKMIPQVLETFFQVSKFDELNQEQRSDFIDNFAKYIGVEDVNDKKNNKEVA